MKKILLSILLILALSVTPAFGVYQNSNTRTGAQVDLYLENAKDAGTASGILKSDGANAITAATDGTDYLSTLVADTTPQLGGFLDLNNKLVTDAANAITGADTTPDVTGGTIFKSGGADTYTDFDDGTDHTNLKDGQLLIILFQHAAGLDCSSSQINCNTGNDWTASDGDAAICVFDDTTDGDGQWVCVISASAPATWAELPTLTAAYIVVGNGSNVAVAVDPAGDVEFDNAGATTIQANAVEESMLKAVDASADEDVLTKEDTTGDFEWHSIDEVIANMSAGALPNDSVVEADLKAVDGATDEDILTKEDTTGDFEWHTIAQVLENVSDTQGTILYRGAAAWSALAVGVSGQYLQTQGAAADPQWASPGISGDVEDVGDCSGGACFTADGTGTTQYFEGTTANAFEAILTSVDVTADVTVTIPEVTGTLVLGPAAFGTDNRLIKTNGTGNLTQITGIAIDDSDNMTGVVGIAATGAVSGNNVNPDAANGATLGTTALEWSDIYLAAGGVIYGENDQGNSITSSATDWIFNLDITVSGGNINTGNIALVIGDATTDTIQLLTDGTGAGEILLPNDSINDEEIDWTDVTAADITMTDAGAINSSGTIAGVDLTASDDIIGQDDLQLDSDLAVIQLGENQDVTLTHVADTGLNLNESFSIADGKFVTFGGSLAASDWTVGYDEAGDDALEFVTAATAAASPTDPMFLIHVDSGDVGMTANQDVFSIYKGTNKLFDVDEDGDVSYAGELKALPADDPYISLDTTTASDTDWWMGTSADQGGDDDDRLEFRTNATPGSNVLAWIEPAGDGAPGLHVAADLWIDGDGLFMATNTDTFILVADGTNFNPVVVGGDATIDNTGVVSVSDLTLASQAAGDVAYVDAGGAWVRLGKGTSGQFLKIGAAIPEWADVSATAQGNDTEVQYNSSGSLGAEAAFTYVAGTNTLTAGDVLVVGTTNPADAGTIRLENAAVIAYEDATEATITHVDDTGFSINLALDVVGALTAATVASDGAVSGTTITATDKISTTVVTEQLRLNYDATNYATWTVDAEGAMIVTTVDADAAAANLTFSPDGTIILTPATDVVGALTAGSMTSDAGVGGTTITASTGFALGDTDYIGITGNEIITFNAAGTIVASGGIFSSTGGTASLTPVKDTAANFAANFTGANLYGGTFLCDTAGTAVLPAIGTGGMNFTIVTLGAIAVVADPNASDLMITDGVAGADGENITNLSTAGDIAVFQYYDATGWLVTTNGWTPE